MTRNLNGKVALVTGGARGIGAAIAKAFAAEGAAVAITFHEHGAEASSVVADVVAAGGRIAAVKADVASEEDAALSVRETINRFGALDILVNNAGVILEKPLLETTAADFDWLMSINLRGTFMTGREAIRHMASVGNGRIINIASDLGYFGRPRNRGLNWRRARFSGCQTHGLAVRTRVGGRVREAFPVLVQENGSAGEPARSGG